ncbi:hypothetical protein GCM10008937_09600 [Deinococcus depolymerans]|uniref:Uncharacterized protein n=1 Tax=Deinococcus depolymerans TaxID=392408 RepID=A0ABP3LNB5_9DEIO
MSGTRAGAYNVTAPGVTCTATVRRRALRLITTGTPATSHAVMGTGKRMARPGVVRAVTSGGKEGRGASGFSDDAPPPPPRPVQSRL